MYKLTRLPSGLRVATCEMPTMESVSVGLWIGVGSRYEPKRVGGITHFIEHLLFKGTRARTAKQISQEIEGIGGYLNAFTGEETTCYYAKASHRHLGILLDVLADMYLRARLAPVDIDKERAVIKEELLMYRDQPQQYVHELLTETMWPGQPLGRAVAGSPVSLDAINRRAVIGYKDRHYTAGNSILAIAGHCRHDDILARARHFFPLPPANGVPRFMRARDRQRQPQLHYLHKEVEQTHLAIGIRAYSRHDSRRFSQKLLSVILGENMSSRLFQVIRERHGLAYAIQTATSYFADTGALYVSAGLDTRRLDKAVTLVLRELRKLAAHPPGPAELKRAKDYSIGQMRLGLESTTNQMMWMGDHLLAYGRIEHPDDIERRVQAVTADDVQRVAADLFHDRRLNVAVITPSKNEAGFRRRLEF